MTESRATPADGANQCYGVDWVARRLRREPAVTVLAAPFNSLGCLLGIKNDMPSIDIGSDWRGPMADRLYLPSADGGRVITDGHPKPILHQSAKLVVRSRMLPTRGIIPGILGYGGRHMNAEQAVQKARDLVVTFFQDQGISRVGLEELDFDYNEDQWTITIGYERNWNDASQFGELIRVYKQLTLDKYGELVSIRNLDSL